MNIHIDPNNYNINIRQFLTPPSREMEMDSESGSTAITSQVSASVFAENKEDDEIMQEAEAAEAADILLVLGSRPTILENTTSTTCDLKRKRSESEGQKETSRSTAKLPSRKKRKINSLKPIIKPTGNCCPLKTRTTDPNLTTEQLLAQKAYSSGERVFELIQTDASKLIKVSTSDLSKLAKKIFGSWAKKEIDKFLGDLSTIQGHPFAEDFVKDLTITPEQFLLNKRNENLKLLGAEIDPRILPSPSVILEQLKTIKPPKEKKNNTYIEIAHRIHDYLNEEGTLLFNLPQKQASSLLIEKFNITYPCSTLSKTCSVIMNQCLAWRNSEKFLPVQSIYLTEYLKLNKIDLTTYPARLQQKRKDKLEKFVTENPEPSRKRKRNST